MQPEPQALTLRNLLLVYATALVQGLADNVL